MNVDQDRIDRRRRSFATRCFAIGDRWVDCTPGSIKDLGVKTYLVVLLVCLPSLSLNAAEFPPVKSGPAQTIDFIFIDFGVFFRDNGNSNAILRFRRAPRKITLDLFLAEGAGLPAPGSPVARNRNGDPVTSYLKASRHLAAITLKRTSATSSVYTVTKVTTTNPQDREKIVFVVGGTVNFDARTGGFDLGTSNVIEIKRTPDADSSAFLRYIEILDGPGDACPGLTK